MQKKGKIQKDKQISLKIFLYMVIIKFENKNQVIFI